jgi:peptidoglycan/LPS O-acetylase OafA/YrhL
MKRSIPPGFSIYLDIVRFGAAAIVVLSHVWALALPQLALPWPGHSAVVIFFVLSGFVIAHASRPELGLRTYAHHRIARIYPVALSAILLSVAVASFVPTNGVRYVGARGSDVQDIVTNVLFLGQSWADVPLPYNAPFWSLNYEVWYYVLFGIAFYSRNRWLLIGAAFIAGPKILLLMPVWLLGVLLYKKAPALSRGMALPIFVLTLVAGLLFIQLDLGVRIREALRVGWPTAIALARGSNEFAGDFLLGLIVALNFMAAWALRLHALLGCEKLIRYLSSITFSMYLFHMPLTLLIWNGLGVHSVPLFFALLAAGIAVLGELTERRTRWYRAWLGTWLFRAVPAPAPAPASAPAYDFTDPLSDPTSVHGDPHA